MKKITVIVIISLCYLAGCSTTHIGKQFPPSRYPTIDWSPKYIKLKHISLEYEPKLDQEKNAIVIEGTVSFNKDMFWAGAELLEITINTVFLDENYVGIEEIPFTKFPETGFFDPVPFIVSSPYNPKYKYILFCYQLWYAE